jgi:HSP20 family protein
MAGTSNDSQASVERVRQEVERWIDVARTAGERALEAVGLTPLARGCHPAVDVLETDRTIEVWVDVPGLSTDAVQIMATATQLTLKVQRPEATHAEGKFHLRERPIGSCERTISLPASVNPDQTQATLRNGVLQITLTRQSAPEPRTVPVSVGT